ncbi:MAG: PorV/PorQ family protein [Ignavibacteria bacterium]|nr:PorV/PorQ family protein [Ignavibacteria bacterium]
MKKLLLNFSMVLSCVMAGAILVHAEETKSSSGTSTGDFRKVGASGGQFLKIGVGARASGMAGAYGSIGSDVTSLYWNSAGIADIQGLAANFTYTSWFAGFSHNFVGGCVPIGDKYRAAVTLTSFSSGNIPITTIEKESGTGSNYQVSDVAIGLSFGGHVTDQFAFGATIKYVQNAFASVSATGVAFDLGTIYKTGFQGTRVAFSIHNLGGQQSYTGADLNRTSKTVAEQNANPVDAQLLTSPYNLPLIFRAGISTDVMSIVNGENATWMMQIING